MSVIIKVFINMFSQVCNEHYACSIKIFSKVTLLSQDSLQQASQSDCLRLIDRGSVIDGQLDS